MNNNIAMRSRVFYISVFGVASLITLAACSDNSNKETTTEQKFPVTSPIVTDTLYTSDYVADIHSVQNVEVRARVSGYVDRVHVDEGEFVKKGQLLFSLNAQEYKEDLAKAKAMLRSAIADSKAAEVDLRSIERLVEKQIVSVSELEVAKSKVDAFIAKIEEAKSQEASANLKLSLTEIRAPFDGGIDRIPNKVGSLISEGELLTTISDNRQVFAYFNVSEQEYLEYAMSEESGKKSEVLLFLANNHVHSSKGIVETVEGKFDKKTGNIAFRARFDNKSGLLKEGSSGKVRLQRKLKDALMVPQKATFEIQDKLFVFVVDDQNIVHLRSLVPKFRMPHCYVVETGLTVQDRILFEGIQLVKEGDKISPQQVAFSQVQPALANNK